MKLLFAIKTLKPSGGAERVFCTVCSELASRGHDITVVTFDRPGTAGFYALDDRVRKVDLGIGDPARPAKLGETWHRMVALRRTATETGPHLAVGFMHSAFVPLAFALAGSKIPAIGSEHIVAEHYRTRPFQRALLLAASPWLTAITVLSQRIKDQYLLPIRRRMVPIPNPVMPAIGEASPGALKRRYTVLSIGRLDTQKDHPTLLKAFARVAAAYPEWDLRILGEGPMRPLLQEMVADLHLDRRVSLPGVTPDVAEEYRGADIFVLPSLYESFGLAAAEAMSYGLPVVAFADCPGTSELIQHAENGMLVPPQPNRSVGLAKTLEQLISQPQLRSQLGSAARLAASRMPSVSGICTQWENLLMSVIGSAVKDSARTRARHQQL